MEKMFHLDSSQRNTDSKTLKQLKQHDFKGPSYT